MTSRRFTRKALAKAVRVSVQAVSAWRNADSVPKGANLTKLAEELRCSEAYILFGEVGTDDDVSQVPRDTIDDGPDIGELSDTIGDRFMAYWSTSPSDPERANIRERIVKDILATWGDYGARPVARPAAERFADRILGQGPPTPTDRVATDAAKNS